MPTPRRPRTHTPPPDDGVTISQEEFDELSERANSARALTAPPSDDPPDEETSTDRVARMLSGLSDDPEARAVVKLYKVIGPNKYAWADDYQVAQFEEGGLKMIREQWGSGEYQIRLYATRAEDGRFLIRAKENITVMAPLVTLPGSNVAPQNGGLESVLRMMAEGQQKLLEAITNRPQADESAAMEKLLKNMALMKTVMGGGEGGGKNSVADTLALMREIREASEEFGGAKPEKEPSIMDLAGNVMSMVAAGRAATPAAPVAASPVRLIENHPTNPEPEAQDPAPETESQGASMFDIILLRKTLAKLTKQAESNGDIEEAAETLADAFDMLENQDAALQMLESPLWWDVLQKIAPETAPHQEWVTKVRDATLAIFADDTDDAPGLPAAANG